MPKIKTSLANIVRLLCAVALLSLNFAHRPVDIEGIASTISNYSDNDDAAIYRLLVTQLCSDEAAKGHGKNTDHHTANSACHACRLSASLLPPPPEQSIVVVALSHHVSVLPISTQWPPQDHAFSPHAPRAPPFFSFI